MIEAAREEFRASGYAATSMVAVAQRAGVSTRTVYRLIPTKADLFGTAVSDRLERFMLAVDADALEAQALERILIAYGELALSEDAIWVHRLLVGESRRFPELAATFYEVAVRGTSDAIAAWLGRQREAGLITLEDVHVSAGMLRGMMSMEPQRAIMLGQRAFPDPQEIAAREIVCAALPGRLQEPAALGPSGRARFACPLAITGAADQTPVNRPHLRTRRHTYRSHRRGGLPGRKAEALLPDIDLNRDAQPARCEARTGRGGVEVDQGRDEVVHGGRGDRLRRRDVAGTDQDQRADPRGPQPDRIAAVDERDRIGADLPESDFRVIAGVGTVLRPSPDFDRRSAGGHSVHFEWSKPGAVRIGMV